MRGQSRLVRLRAGWIRRRKVTEKRRLFFEQLEPRQMLTAAGFTNIHDLHTVGPMRPAGWIDPSAVDAAVQGLTSTGNDLPIIQRQVASVAYQGDLVLQTMQSSNLVGRDRLQSDPQLTHIDGHGYSIVVIDSGIDLDHPFFGPDANGDGISDRILFSYDFSGSNDSDASDQDGHGSNVTSIATSSDVNRPGVASGAGIIHLKVISDEKGSATSRDIEEALQWTVAHASQYNIASVNMSLGHGNFDYIRDNSAWADELSALESLRVITVAAAGNDFHKLDSATGIALPAADPSVISVGAVFDRNIGRVAYGAGARADRTAADIVTPFSQRHPQMLDVFAPGAPISGAGANGGIVTQHGTSQASPHVAGAAALAQQLAGELLGRRLSLDEFRHLLAHSSTMVGDGDDELDNVTNTGAQYPRLDLVKMSEGIRQLQPGSIRGRLFHDLAADGDSPADPGLGGQLVFLDFNENGLRDSGHWTYHATAASQEIADKSMLQSTLVINDSLGPIADINVTVDIEHDWNADLTVYLFSPQGSRIELVSGVGNGQRDFRQTFFDDQAIRSIRQGAAPYQGAFRPTESLSQLAGENPRGRWVLEVHDRFDRDQGQLNSWSLQVTAAEPQTVTDTSGHFEFEQLTQGNYHVYASVAANWLPVPSTSQSGPSRHLNLLAGEVSESVSFAYQTSLQVRLEESLVREDAGGAATYLIVSRQSVSTAEDLVVELSHDDSSEVILAEQAVIPAGQEEVRVPISIVDDNLLDGMQQVTLTASSDPLGSDFAVLSVADHEQLLLTAEASTISENAGAGAVEITIARTDTDSLAALSVQLQSLDTSEIVVPSAIQLAAGQSSTSFLVDAIDDAILDGRQQVSVEARANGYEAGLVSLEVLDHEPLQVTVDNHVALVSAEGGRNRLTIHRGVSDVAVPLLVELDWSGAEGVLVAENLVIPAGASSADVDLEVMDPASWITTRVLTVTVTAAGYEAATESLWFSRDVGIHLDVSQDRIAENAGTAGLAWTVSRVGMSVSDDLAVRLESSDTSELVLPAVVVIPAGADRVVVLADVLDDDIQDGVQRVTVTATTDSQQPVELTIDIEDYETWQNPVNRLDVDNNGRVTPLDVLALINRIALSGELALPANSLPPGGPDSFLDVDGDLRLSSRDAEVVVDHYNEVRMDYLSARMAEANQVRMSDRKTMDDALFQWSLPQRQLPSREAVATMVGHRTTVEQPARSIREMVFAETSEFSGRFPARQSSGERFVLQLWKEPATREDAAEPLWQHLDVFAQWLPFSSVYNW